MTTLQGTNLILYSEADASGEGIRIVYAKGNSLAVQLSQNLLPLRTLPLVERWTPSVVLLYSTNNNIKYHKGHLTRLQYSLGVNSDIIMEDYRLSNDYFNIPSASSYAYNLPTRSQEAITTIYSAREDFLNAAKEEIERRYGDVDTYLQRAIGLTKEEIKKLQSILLVKND